MRIEEMRAVRGILSDMDGVWFVENTPVPGAVEALESLRARGVPLRLISNTTTKTRAQLARKMRDLGFAVADEEVLSPPAAAVRLLRARGVRRARLVVSDAIRGEFAEFEGPGRPEAIVIGDIGHRWSYDLMSELFRQVLDGAEIVALHKGRYWQVEDGLALDIGAFVAGLEYATGKPATVVGKPSPELFRAALADLNLAASDVVMIGDDIHHDVAGAQSAGIRGVLVKTGKYREHLVAGAGIRPDLVIESVEVLARCL
jgi:HAD superfamily hydrolase (TIGR01458 family)